MLSESGSRFGAIQFGVILLAVATGLIHLYLFVKEGFLGSGSMLAIFQLLFVLNFLAYVILAAALYLPSLGRYQRLMRVLLVSVAVAAFASYLYVGVFDLLGNVTKAIEVLLFALLAVDAGSRGRSVLGTVLQMVAGTAVGIVLFLLLTTVIG
jgi:hypothetical protein